MIKSAGRRAVAVTMAAAVCTALFSTGTAEAIVKGGDSTQRYPFMASISETVSQTGDRGVCGASLIDPQWVVTAGHCVDSTLVTPDGTVRIGSERQHSGGTVRRIAQVVTHPGYALQSEKIPFNRNDIALIKLDRPVVEKPVRLASRPGAPGTPTRLLGFGTTVDTYDFKKARFAERLQELDVRRGAESECSPGYAGRTRLCTVSPRPEAMACIGDSGGPQVRRGAGGRWELIGVTSGPGNARSTCAGGPGLYSSVPAYADWIRRTIWANRGGN
ncbi:S1 family peptidase [Amycolatopsis circi]|uniref:S1 family peptidase n=1 Tax=Amycolatopsis circi TaxID=871959 RepID=UPI000E23DA5A|nr:serine protease [Amycolatopsis circi]